MAGKRFWEKLSPRTKKNLRTAVWIAAGLLAAVALLLLLRGAEMLHDIFRAGLKDVYYN